METIKNRVLVVATLLLLTSQCAGLCQDLDTQACQSMTSQDQHFCRDSPLASSICKKYCKKCPLVCYHCDNTVNNYTDCTSTRECQIGEQCILHQLLSSKDGHREYKMTCASLDICDGSGIMMLGRRHINSRNLITQCCSEDLCNYPGNQQTTSTTKQTTTSEKQTTSTPIPTTTTTTTTTTTRKPLPIETTHAPYSTSCFKDIEFVIEDARNTHSHDEIRDYLKDIVTHLSIGFHQSLVGMALFNSDVDKKFDLDDHAYKFDLLHRIDHVDFEHRTNDIDKGDVMEFLQDKLRAGHHGNRPNYPDVVVIVVDHFSRNARFIVDHLQQTIPLSDLSKDVIIINVGAAGRHSEFSNLATDSSHVIDVDSYQSLSTSLNRVLGLICA